MKYMIEGFDKLLFADQLKLCSKILLNYQDNKNFLNKELPKKAEDLAKYFDSKQYSNRFLRNIIINNGIELKVKYGKQGRSQEIQKNVEQFKKFYNENQIIIENLRKSILSGPNTEEKLKEAIDQQVESLTSKREPRLTKVMNYFKFYLSELVISDKEIKRAEFCNKIRNTIGDNFDLSNLDDEKKKELKIKSDEYFSQFSEKEIRCIKLKVYLKEIEDIRGAKLEDINKLNNRDKDILLSEVVEYWKEKGSMKKYVQKFAIGDRELQELKDKKQEAVAKERNKMKNWQNTILTTPPGSSRGV